MLTVGYQGVRGSFSEEALYNYFKNVKAKNYEQFKDIFISLDENLIDYGVLPIENSSTGAISDVYDLLNQYNAYIVGETYVKPIQNLLGLKNSTIEQLEEIYSHPQGFEQSKTYLSSFNWKLIPYYNTAKSAEYVMNQNNPKIGAIASKKAAEIYNLKILKENINCNETNTTRFIIIGKNLEVSDTSDKVSIILSTNHKPGDLYNALGHFAKNNINIVKIESRPVKHTPWQYYFYIDFEGNINNPSLQKFIDEMKMSCQYFKLLGNYKSNR